jgi:transaldolase
MNALLKLKQHGQSYWLDNLDRQALRGGHLARRVRNEALGGVTSNPKTFFDAITGSHLYDERGGGQRARRGSDLRRFDRRRRAGGL